MEIRKLDTELNGLARATITLDYNEIRDISNILCRFARAVKEQKVDDYELNKYFNEIHRNFVMLFALLKHGNIPDFECALMHELDNRADRESLSATEPKIKA